MELVCKSCKKAFNLNPIEVSSASVNYSLGRTHTFKCDHCKTANTLTKAEFEGLKNGKQPFVAAAPAPKPAAAPAGPAAKPVAKPVAVASKPVAAASMPPREMAKDDAPKVAPPMPATVQPREGTVMVASLHVRKDHSTTSETVAGLVKGNKVKIIGTWTDGKNTWAQIGPDQWAAVEHNGKKMIDVA